MINQVAFRYTDEQWSEIQAEIPICKNVGENDRHRGDRNVLEACAQRFLRGDCKEEARVLRGKRLIGNKTDFELQDYIEGLLHRWHLYEDLSFGRKTNKTGVTTLCGPLIRFLTLATDPVMEKMNRTPLKPDALDYLIRCCRAQNGLTWDFDDLDEWMAD